MKIKISPSYPEEGYISVEIDTLTNEDLTVGVVDSALAAIEACGHSDCNIIEAARKWCNDREMWMKRREENE